MRLTFWSIVYIITAMLILRPQCGYASGHRAKRVIAFRKGSSFFFRLNYKIATIETSMIFAQATGFKVVWKLPSSDTGSRKRRNVNEIHESIALVYESHGFNGESCLAKNICQALKYAEGRDGVMAKIFRLLAKKKDFNEMSSNLDAVACNEYKLRCPLELINVKNFINY